MNVVTRLLLVVPLQALGLSSAIAEGFSFGGLSLKTTAEELRRRYPDSMFVGNYLYVAQGESTDHISGIQLPSRAGAGPLKLFFERVNASTSTRAPQYPDCNDLVSVLEAKYGPPAATEEFSEERARDRRLTWKRAGEVLVLQCFRRKDANFFAETLSIEKTAE